VSEEGVLTSKVSSVRGRFIAALNQLLSGRLCLSSKGVGRAKQALVVAVRYAATRLCVGESVGCLVLARHGAGGEGLMMATFSRANRTRPLWSTGCSSARCCH
jgi:hypothetical protein